MLLRSSAQLPQLTSATEISLKEREKQMYEMYPEDWGPARHRREAAEAVQTALDLRDNGGEPPEDN